MFAHLRPAIVMTVLFTVLTGLLYPLAVTAVAQLALPSKANGSLVARGDAVVGSALIGQSFTDGRYFHGRPSAAGADGYDAGASSGSNLGPTSKKLIDRVTGAVSELKTQGAADVPADAVTTSASGLDPHISPAFAALQVDRIAKARGLDRARVELILARNTELPVFGIVGEPRVNVLRLNLALDAEPAAGAG